MSGSFGRYCIAVADRGQRGTSLLEVLTVVAIIALLASLMMPQLSQSRQASKKAVCLARLKSIATSGRVYEADDPNGWGIPVHPGQYTQDPGNPTFIGAYEWGGKSGIGRDDFLTGTPGQPLFSKYGTRAGFGPASRPLNETIYVGGLKNNLHPWDRVGSMRDTQLDLKLFRCPADDGPPRGGHCPDWVANSDRSSYDHFGNSYAANLFMTGSSAGGLMSSNSPYMRPITRVPTPSRTLFWEENIGRWAWAAREDWCDFMQGIDVGATKAIDGWHGKNWTYNRAFGDTHAETQRIYIEGTEDDEGYANHYRTEYLSWYPPDQYGNPGSWGYYRCIIIRGPGWQKDTLPAPQIPTGLWTPGGGRPSYEDCVWED